MTDERPPDEQRTPPSYGGPERREPDKPDRRTKKRGGRRATDVLKQVARFVHDLLTEMPR